MSFSVVIPSGSYENLVQSVQAIRQAGETCRIIVVGDNLQQVPADCTFIPGPQPFQFTRNANLGITAAGEDDVVLMNDDVLLLTRHGFTMLEKMSVGYGAMSAGIVGLVGNPNQVWKRAAEIRDEPKWLCFVCTYLPRRTLDQVGLLDENFGLAGSYGFEDTDLSWRIAQAGLKLGVWDGTIVEHGSLHSVFQQRTGRDLEHNREVFRQKWGEVW